MSSTRFGLDGRVVIVTGAARGIGAACARRFADEGCRVMIADVDADTGQALADELGARFFRADVGSSRDCDALVAATVDAFGGLDILVNNAGIIHSGDFLEMSEDDFDRVLRVNLKGAFLMTQRAARAMIPDRAVRGGGAIVNMSSVNALLVIQGMTAYNVSKGGLNQLTRSAALALVDHGIRVNAVGPGTIATEMARSSVMTNDAARRKLMSRTPMKRLGEPEEIAATVAFLASDAASYITGQVVYADGGRLGLNYSVEVD